MLGLCAGAVFMPKKNWMRPVGFCAGAPMANFVLYLFFCRTKMFLRTVTESNVETYRNPIMKDEARCVGYGSCWPGASGRLCRRCERANTAGGAN